MRVGAGSRHEGVGRTPWSARVPPDPLFGAHLLHQQADEGVGRGPGGPPHLTRGLREEVLAQLF